MNIALALVNSDHFSGGKVDILTAELIYRGTIKHLDVDPAAQTITIVSAISIYRRSDRQQLSHTHSESFMCPVLAYTATGEPDGTIILECKPMSERIRIRPKTA